MKYLFLIISFCILIRAFPQETLVGENTPQIKCVSSITDNNLSDFTVIDSAIEGKSIIILGEENHFDGATRDYKNKLIQYLHERKGFNVLIREHAAFEDDYAFEKLKNGTAPDSLISQLLNVGTLIYTTSDSVLYTYIQQQLKTKNPLFYTGMDLMVYGVEVDYKFYEEIIKILQLYKLVSPLKDAKFIEMTTIHAYIFNHPREKGNINRLIDLKEYVDYYKIKIDSILVRNNSSLDAISKLKLTKRYLDDYYEGAVFHIKLSKIKPKEDLKSEGPFLLINRDSLMAENVKWIMKNRFPDEKVIISCSNIHAISSYIPDIICEKKFKKGFIGTNTLGYQLKKTFGNQVYSIATITYEGAREQIYNNGVITLFPIESRSKDGLEFLLSQKCDFGFVGFDQQYFKNKNDCFKMFPTFEKEYSFQWGKGYDGVFFIKNMYPFKIGIFRPHSE